MQLMKNHGGDKPAMLTVTCQLPALANHQVSGQHGTALCTGWNLNVTISNESFNQCVAGCAFRTYAAPATTNIDRFVVTRASVLGTGCSNPFHQ